VFAQLLWRMLVNKEYARCLNRVFKPNLTVFCIKSQVYSFWAATPTVVSESVTMHWIASGPEQLVYRRGEQRCILIASGLGRADRMYAKLRPCNAKLADGILTVAAAAARKSVGSRHARPALCMYRNPQISTW
jgi:hypothetical protein